MRLIIKFPTRNRPEKFKEVYTLYEQKLSGKHDVMFVITMDYDDPTMNNPEMISWLNSRNSNVRYHYGFSKTKIEAVNANLTNLDADVLMIASDDMWPEMDNYDDVIYQKFQEHFPDYNGAIKFSDGFRSDDLMTLCIMGWSLYKKFGYVYCPEYVSVFADTEQTFALHALKRYVMVPEVLCSHKWKREYDDLHARNENGMVYAKDQATFDHRKQHNFYINDIIMKELRLPNGSFALESVQGTF